jgi:hypothetical protein
VASAPTLPCPVALCLRTNFTTYEAVSGGGGQVVKWHAQLGPALEKYAVYVAKSVFGDVQVVTAPPITNNAKLMLVVQVTSSDFQVYSGSVATLGWGGTAMGALTVEWNFNDPNTGQKLFSTRIRGEASHGTGFHPPFLHVVDDLMVNLTAKTIQHLDHSSDVQRLSGH